MPYPDFTDENEARQWYTQNGQRLGVPDIQGYVDRNIGEWKSRYVDTKTAANPSSLLDIPVLSDPNRTTLGVGGEGVHDPYNIWGSQEQTYAALEGLYGNYANKVQSEYPQYDLEKENQEAKRAMQYGMASSPGVSADFQGVAPGVTTQQSATMQAMLPFQSAYQGAISGNREKDRQSKLGYLNTLGSLFTTGANLAGQRMNNQNWWWQNAERDPG